MLPSKMRLSPLLLSLLLGTRVRSFSLYPTVDPDKLASSLNISIGCLDALNSTVNCENDLFQWTVTVDDHWLGNGQPYDIVHR